jgi:2-dehydro-3-deoxyphosphogluconate aldolase/(4S)-4-hydroxy-2-oxoglutarate aldolase
MDLERTLEAIRVVPVVTFDQPEDAVPVVDALVRGGLPCLEITFRSSAAAEAIALVAARDPGFLVGAGTVLTTEQADTAIEAGAKFIVAPGLNAAVVRHVLKRGVPMLPGIATATELDAARALGLRMVKVFPAEALGGPGYVRALGAPFPMMRFVPTGGVTAANLGDYLALPSVVAVGGTWIAKRKIIAAGDFALIERLAAEAVTRRQASVDHAEAATPAQAAGSRA